jgi:hypothetical protein
MHRIRMAICFCLLMALGHSVMASDYVPLEKRLNTAQLRETGLDTLSAEQLHALNQLLAAETAKQANIASPAMPHAAALAKPKADAPTLGFTVEPIRSRLVGTVASWQEGTVFELENGQQWKVLKGYMTLPKPMQNPEIRVVPGIAGRWFLEVHEDYPKARVYLIN